MRAMDATTNAWNVVTPELPVLAREHWEDFLANAPYGAVILAWDDIYKHTGDGDWLELEIVHLAEWMGDPTAEHGEASAADIIKMVDGRGEIKLIKLS